MQSLAGEVTAASKRHFGVKPDPAGVAEYVKLLDLCWGSRFGEDDADGEE